MDREDKELSGREAMQLAEAEAMLERLASFSNDPGQLDIHDVVDVFGESELPGNSAVDLTSQWEPIDIGIFRNTIEDYTVPASAAPNRSSAVRRPTVKPAVVKKTGPARLKTPVSDDVSRQVSSSTPTAASDEPLFGPSTIPLADQIAEPALKPSDLESEFRSRQPATPDFSSPPASQTQRMFGSGEVRPDSEIPPQKDWQPEDWKAIRGDAGSTVTGENDQLAPSIESLGLTAEKLIESVMAAMERIAASTINAHQRLDEIERTLDGYGIDEFNGAE